jgi:hypothetical protein
MHTALAIGELLRLRLPSASAWSGHVVVVTAEA